MSNHEHVLYTPREFLFYFVTSRDDVIRFIFLSSDFSIVLYFCEFTDMQQMVWRVGYRRFNGSKRSVVDHVVYTIRGVEKKLNLVRQKLPCPMQARQSSHQRCLGFVLLVVLCIIFCVAYILKLSFGY